LPAITEDLTINGPGANVITVRGNDASRVFEIASGVTVMISDLAIGNGNASGANGSGILNSGTLTVTNTTQSNNSPPGVAVNGGGTVTITNSTFSGNSAGESGGGIFNSSGTVNVSNSTLSNNSAASFGGGIRNDSGTVNIKNSIVANSPSGGDCSGSGTLNALGVNFSTSGSCLGFTQVPATGPGGLNLGPLANNGGPTQTHALLSGSVAIDAVTDCTDVAMNPVTTDQRGVTRPQDGDSNGTALCDAGAFEAIPCTLTCPANITKATTPTSAERSSTIPRPQRAAIRATQ